MQRFNINRTNSYLIPIAIILYALHVVYAGFSHRVLYPDGSIYVTYILESGETIWWHWHRYFAYLIQHFPLVSLVRLGYTNVNMMITVHSTWYHSFFFISLVICWFTLPRDKKTYMVYPLLSVFAVYTNVEFFVITPGRFLVALFWSLLFLIQFKKGWLGLLLTLLFALPTLRSYQGMLFLGFPLVYAAFTRYRSDEGWLKKAFWMGMTGYFIGGIVIAVVSILQPQDPTSFITFILGIVLFLDEELYPHFPFLISTYGLLLLVFYQFKKKGSEQFIRKHLKIFIVGAVLVVAMPIIWPQSLAPEAHQQVRSLNVYINTALGLIFLGQTLGKVKLKNKLTVYALLIAGVLGITQSLWNMQATLQWNKYRALLHTELKEAPDGVLLFEQSDFKRIAQDHRMSNGIHNDWATGYLSIYTLADNDKKTLMAHTYDNLFRPFDVRDSTELPDLARYGISFDIFKSGLREQLTNGELTIPDRPLPEILKWFETDTVGVNNYFEDE